MSQEFIMKVVGTLILSIIINIVIEIFKHWKKRRKERERLQNTSVTSARPFDIDSENQMESSIPPLPIRQTQLNSQANRQSPSDIIQSQQGAGGYNSPPALPQRQTIIEKNPENFPRCPIHKCCNRRGEEQKIFWDNNIRMWRCYHGHNFFS